MLTRCQPKKWNLSIRYDQLQYIWSCIMSYCIMLHFACCRKIHIQFSISSLLVKFIRIYEFDCCYLTSLGMLEEGVHECAVDIFSSGRACKGHEHKCFICSCKAKWESYVQTASESTLVIIAFHPSTWSFEGVFEVLEGDWRSNRKERFPL